MNLGAILAVVPFFIIASTSESQARLINSTSDKRFYH